jgi:Domain of unknown function (DUF4232)
MTRIRSLGLLALLTVAALAGACGSSHHRGAPGSSVPPSAAPATTSSTAAPGSSSPPTSASPAPTNPATTVPGTSPATLITTCRSSQLTASLGPANGTAGTVYYPLIFTNHGSTTCTLYGYPGVSFVTGAAGRQVGAPAQRVPGPSSMVTLVPGHTATATLGIVDASNFGPGCQLTTVQGLRVYPPGQTAALFVSHTDQGCANPADKTLTIRPITAS